MPVCPATPGLRRRTPGLPASAPLSLRQHRCRVGAAETAAARPGPDKPDAADGPKRTAAAP